MFFVYSKNIAYLPCAILGTKGYSSEQGIQNTGSGTNNAPSLLQNLLL